MNLNFLVLAAAIEQRFEGVPVGISGDLDSGIARAAFALMGQGRRTWLEGRLSPEQSQSLFTYVRTCLYPLEHTRPAELLLRPHASRLRRAGVPRAHVKPEKAVAVLRHHATARTFRPDWAVTSSPDVSGVQDVLDSLRGEVGRDILPLMKEIVAAGGESSLCHAAQGVVAPWRDYVGAAVHGGWEGVATESLETYPPWWRWTRGGETSAWVHLKDQCEHEKMFVPTHEPVAAHIVPGKLAHGLSSRGRERVERFTGSYLGESHVWVRFNKGGLESNPTLWRLAYEAALKK